MRWHRCENACKRLFNAAVAAELSLRLVCCTSLAVLPGLVRVVKLDSTRSVHVLTQASAVAPPGNVPSKFDFSFTGKKSSDTITGARARELRKILRHLPYCL